MLMVFMLVLLLWKLVQLGLELHLRLALILMLINGREKSHLSQRIIEF